jgi:hypothetical protein
MLALFANFDEKCAQSAQKTTYFIKYDIQVFIYFRVWVLFQKGKQILVP